ncbi:MAG: substrate-binding domain-containing protein [Raineya sp.]|jgi:phosphate transport system substrate-binding protein|nr:substrate-binding domain-containing protein [Raineya sp.]
MIYRLTTFCLLLTLYACSSNSENNYETKKYDTPTSGEITVAVDEAFLPIAQQEAKVFENEYDKAKINIVALPEDKAIQLMLRDSIDAVIVGRDLNSQEKKEIERQKSMVRSWVQAYDGVAVVVHPESTDTTWTVEQLKDLFSGKIKNWKDIKASNSDAEISIILDNANSSNYNYTSTKLEVSDISKLKIYAAKSNKTVVEKVSKDKNSIGLVGYSWLSSNDVETEKLKSSVKLVSISNVQPSQVSLLENSYPFKRECYSLVKNGRMGLAFAFASYINQEIGQRIILKAGILPAKIPAREIEILKK